MINIEVVKELNKKVKTYIGIMKQSKFSTYCKRIENDMCKPKTVKKFFGLFGYVGEWNNYEKTRLI